MPERVAFSRVKQYQKPLSDLTDKELHDGLRELARTGGGVMASVNDHMRDLERRSANRNARTLRCLTVVLVSSTIVYTIATLALVVVTWLKP